MQTKDGLTDLSQGLSHLKLGSSHTTFAERQNRNRKFLKLSRQLTQSKNENKIFNTMELQSYSHRQSDKNQLVSPSSCKLSAQKQLASIDLELQNSDKTHKKQSGCQKSELDTSSESFSVSEVTSERKKTQLQRQQFMFQKWQQAEQRNTALQYQSCLPKITPLFISLRASELSESNPRAHSVLNFEYSKNEQFSHLNHDELQSLPHSIHFGESKVCHICLDQVITSERETYLFCFHSFHTECIDVWLTSHSTCPLCKMDMKREVKKRHLYQQIR